MVGTSLTFALTYYFPILKRRWGVPPKINFARRILLAMGQRLKESLGRSESNGIQVDLFRSYIDPSRSSQIKNSNFEMYRFWRITFELRKVPDSFKHHRVSLSKMHRNIYFVASEGQVENLTSGQSNMMIDLC